MSDAPVPSEWPTVDGPKIAFIGEAPGFEETLKLRPLVGPSGKVFNAGLRAANIDRASVFVGNVFSHKAENNDVGPWMHDRNIYGEELERLQRELERFSPACIVPLGGTALWAFTGHTGIRDFRGAVQPATRVVSGAKLLPTYHPQAVQKQWKLLSVFIGDLIKALSEALRGPGIVYPKVALHLDPSISDVRSFIQGPCRGARPLSVDIETGWGQITMISLTPDPHTSMCIPFVDFRRPNRSYWQRPEEELEVWGLLADLLADPSIPKLGQNFVYDTYWLWEKHGIALMNYSEDTRLKHHALFPELEKSLAFMGAKYTDLGAWKQWGGGASREKRDDL